jgi:CRP-like cAMP-binding protein
LLDVGFDVYAVFGFLGIAFYLGSYAALQLGYLNGQGGLYAVLNLIAASSVLISLTAAFNLSSAVIQIFWIFISIIGLIRIYLLTRKIHFTDEESAFLKTALPDLAKSDARKFLDAGYWIDGRAGTQLTLEGEPVQHLIYLACGTAEIISSEKTIAVCEAGSFIGELTAISGEPATATVLLTRDSRYFCVGAEVLRNRLLKNRNLRTHLENCVASQMLHKLKASNKVLADNNLSIKA